MLEMSRQAAVFGDRRPAVLFNFNFVTSSIDHRLDGQNHPFLQSNPAVRLTIIWHRRFLMQLLTDALTHEGADNPVAPPLSGLLNRKTQIPHPPSVFQLLKNPLYLLPPHP